MTPTKEFVKLIKNNHCFNITYKFDWHPSTSNFRSLIQANTLLYFIAYTYFLYGDSIKCRYKNVKEKKIQWWRSWKPFIWFQMGLMYVLPVYKGEIRMPGLFQRVGCDTGNTYSQMNQPNSINLVKTNSVI